MSKQAPPLGNLTRDNATVDATKPLPSPKLPAANPVAPTPIREVVSTRPDLPQNIDLTNVGSTARDALAVDNATRSDNTPVPMFQQLPSRPEMPVSDIGLQQLAGDESTPFNYTGFGAGTVGQETITTLPTAGIARHSSDIGSYVDNPLNFTGSSDVVIANSQPVNQFQYSEGLTQSQRNSREFFNGLQQFRQDIAPHMLPALQFTPQQLNPGVAGGFGPTAETKGPLSWLLDGPQTNINPLAGEFGASGGGLLGGLGWVMGRLSPTTWLKGAALDVSRSGAALWEGGSAGIGELLKTGDFGKAMNAGGSAMEENYYSNAPQARGVYTQTFGGSKDVGDELTQSYFLAAVSGMTDMGFSGVGQNPLLVGEGMRDVVLKGDNFNPFGLRDPLRSGFNTGALEAKERQQGAWFGHGYDQWAKGALGLVLGDIGIEGLVDATAIKALNKAVAGTTIATKVTTRISQEGIQALRLNDARQAGTMVHVPRAVPLRDIPDISAFLPKKSPTKPGVPTAKGGAIVPVRRSESGISQVVQGELLPDNASAIVLRRQRNAPTYNDPIRNRYLPGGSDPFATKSSRVYTPDVGINFDAGGAIIAYSGKEASVVPAVLGVGGKPGGIPVMPRVEDGRVFVASGDTTPVTVWDNTTQSFVSVGKQPTEVQRVLNAPGATTPIPPSVMDDIIEGELVPNAPISPVSPPANTRVSNSPVEAPVPPVGRNTPEVPVTRPVEPARPLSEDGSVPASRTPTGKVRPKALQRKPEVDEPNTTPYTPRDVSPNKLQTGTTVSKLQTPFKAPTVEGYSTTTYPVLVPKDAPNFTVQPTVVPDDVRASHVVDDVTGTFRNADDVLAVGNRGLSAPVVDELPPVVPIPVRNVEYVTAEAISPSVNSADIVRRLTSGDDIPGASYNPRQMQRGTRSIQSVVSLARQVTLPGGVRILSDDIKDVSVMKFARLQKKVDAAIIASGMNPSSTEAAGIRRLFDKVGKPLPTNLSPDFSIEVAARGVNQPSVYVQPAKAVSDGNVTWTGRAARYTETYPMSDDYAIGVKVKYDEELNRIVPVDGQDMKLIPSVRTEPGTSIGRSQLLDMPVVDRKAVVGKSFKDGYDVPKGAVDDATTPDISYDTVAARDYARTNLPKDDVPSVINREAREVLSKHHELVTDVAYTQEMITDISTQLTDVERQLSEYLKLIDTLPDIGVKTLSDDVPVPGPSTRAVRNIPMYDMKSITEPMNVRYMANTVPIGVSTGLESVEIIAGSRAFTPREPIKVVTPEELPYAMRQVDEFAGDFDVEVPEINLTVNKILDVANIRTSATANLDGNQLAELFGQGALLTPVVKQVGLDDWEVVAGSRYVAEYNNAIKASRGELVDRMYVRIIDDKQVANSLIEAQRTRLGNNRVGGESLEDVAERKRQLDEFNKANPTNVSAPANTVRYPELYHGTRVEDLNINSVDPVMGASRSEYGTGVWLTKDQGIAQSAAGRVAPDNMVPNVNRTISESAYIHEVDPESLRYMNIPFADDPIMPKDVDRMVDHFSDNTYELSRELFYGDDLMYDLVESVRTGKVKSYHDLFAQASELTYRHNNKIEGVDPTEIELTYVQRVVTNLLRDMGVDGLTNGTNTVIYSTKQVTTKYIHNVTDIVGDASDDVTNALHNVNLIQKSLDAAPSSKLLQVQLAEAKAVAASKIRDSLSDELEELNGSLGKQVSDLMDQDDVVRELASRQRSEEMIRATTKDENTLKSFDKELNRSDWNGPCL